MSISFNKHIFSLIETPLRFLDSLAILAQMRNAQRIGSFEQSHYRLCLVPAANQSCTAISKSDIFPKLQFALKVQVIQVNCFVIRQRSIETFYDPPYLCSLSCFCVEKKERLSLESTRNEKKYCITHLVQGMNDSKFYVRKI